MTLLLGLALAVFGAYLLSQNLRTRRRARAMRAWPTAPGVVTAPAAYTVKTVPDSDGGSETYYDLKLRVRFAPEGPAQAEREVDEAMQTTSQSQADAWVAEYAEGRDVRVSYDPADPSQTALNPALHDEGVFGMVVAVGLTLFGLVLALGG